MMDTHSQKSYLFLSAIAHVIVLAIVVISVDFSAPLPVLENTHKQDVISAMVLGDTPKSTILPKLVSAPSPPQPKVIPKEKRPPPVAKPKLEEEAIALKAAAKKQLVDQKTKELLADIKAQDEKQKKDKQKALQAKFEKTLREQAEKSLRQQLLKEEIKLSSTQSRQSQGQVDKYKALILQTISEHWIVPVQANKERYCELMIRLAPGGMVLDVQVTKTSGDPSLDSSARAAVLKASPLPVPSNAEAFEPFRQFILKVKPENVLS